MKSMDAILFEDIFSWKEAQENHSFKRTITLK
jgi:arginine deiminase